jgi:hypothetical protein
MATTIDDVLANLRRSPLAHLESSLFRPDPADRMQPGVEHVERYRTSLHQCQGINVEVSSNGVVISTQLARGALRSPEAIEGISAFLCSTPFSFPHAWVAGCAIGGLESEAVEVSPQWQAKAFELEAPVSVAGLLSVLRGHAGSLHTDFHDRYHLDIINGTPAPNWITIRVDNLRHYYFGGGIERFHDVLPCPWGWELVYEDEPPDGVNGRLRRAVASCCAGRSEPAQLVEQLRSITADADLDEAAIRWLTAALEASAGTHGTPRTRYELARLLDGGGVWEETFWERTRNFQPHYAVRVLRHLPTALPGDPRVATAGVVLRVVFGESDVFDLPGLLDPDDPAARPFLRLLDAYGDGEYGESDDRDFRQRIWSEFDTLVTTLEHEGHLCGDTDGKRQNDDNDRP